MNRNEMDPSYIPYAKTSPKCIKDTYDRQNFKIYTKSCRRLSDNAVKNAFLNKSPKNANTEGKSDTFTCTKIRDTIQEVRKQATNWENMFVTLYVTKD